MTTVDIHEEETEAENYFVSMTDMMVGMVFIFIILLMYFALQFRDVTDQLAGADQTRTKILQQLQQSLKAKGVEVAIDTQNGVLHLPDAILFDSGHWEIKPEGRAKVAHLGEALADVLPCYSDTSQSKFFRVRKCQKTKHFIESLFIEGHTDSDVFAGGGPIQDNMDLSALRATNTYRELIHDEPDLDKLCVRQGPRCAPILSVSGYGPQRPVDPGASDTAKRRNRRIDLRIIMNTPDAGAATRAVTQRLEE